MQKEFYIKQIFFKGGLDKNLTGYENRPQQIDMVEGIQKVIETEGHLIVEAGTGTGKSLAYLI
ncbi:MAG: hypothetical protein AB1633_05020 [Elusimicrobiota bacterium]